MLPATTKAGGKCVGAPDTCKLPTPTGPVPTPYPNMGQASNAKDVIKKVKIEKKETVVESSAVKNSKGDELGSLKGMISQTHRKDVKFKKYSSKVYAQNKKIVHHTAMTTHNGTNPNLPTGAHVDPSQTKVMVAT
ncbi:MAG: type VI secretion protein [Deltaproteobacteria bacterium]|nr:MAG: type VI secretion protein [Deltaproteobacteria bacterium]